MAVSGCHNSVKAQEAQESQTIQQVHPTINEIQKTHQMDAKSNAYLAKCEASDSFQVQARVTAVVYPAVESGAMSTDQAVAILEQMDKKHPGNSSYWQGCIKHLRDKAANK